ncbi:positive regulation of plasma cell differentiation, partial [Coemansia sp. RSA 1933]
MSRVSSVTPHAADKVEKDAGIGAGVGAGGALDETSMESEDRKRKYSAADITTPGEEIDLSLLGPPRPGRPPRTASQDPAMQEARKRARVLRNRAAAQNSREKKRHHLETLEQENTELRAKNTELEERLSRAEDANAALSSKLDMLSQQFQGLQSLLLDTQKQQVPVKSASLPLPVASAAQQQPSLLDWSTISVSPLHTPLDNTSQSFTYTNAIASPTPQSHSTFDSTPTLDGTSSTAPSIASSTSLLSAMTDAIVATSPGLKPSAAMEEHTSSVAASSEFSSKDLSESAALEQSGTHEFRVKPDSQQRMPLPCTENIYRNHRQQTQSLEATLEAYSSTSSCKNWGQRMASLAVAVIVSASPQTSPQSLWTMFCALWWIISQSGGWISKHQVSRIARGILESPQQHQRHQTTANRSRGSDDIVAALLSKTTARTAAHTMPTTTRPSNVNGMTSLALLASWLSPGTRSGAALRRVAGSEAVDKVCGLVAELRAAARSTNSRKHHRIRTSGAA